MALLVMGWYRVGFLLTDKSGRNGVAKAAYRFFRSATNLEGASHMHRRFTPTQFRAGMRCLNTNSNAECTYTGSLIRRQNWLPQNSLRALAD